MLDILLFASIVTTSLALVTAGAHALELPNKITLSRDDYLTVQQIYQGWNRFGWFEGLALVFTIAVFFVIGATSPVRLASLIAVISLIAMGIAFWFVTLPANKQTDNWTKLPDNWVQLRSQWEYSHAARAAFALVALIAEIVIAINI